MEQQTQAMRSEHVCDAACACPYEHHNREGGNALCVTSTSDRSQKQTGNSKLGLSSCRESHRQKEARRKAVCILLEAEQSLVKALLPQEPPFLPGASGGMANSAA